jgi:hypothetical protein
MERAKEKSQTIHELALEGDFEVTFVRIVGRTVNYSHPYKQCCGTRSGGAFLTLGSQTDISESLVTIFWVKVLYFFVKWLKLFLYLSKNKN